MPSPLGESLRAFPPTSMFDRGETIDMESKNSNNEPQGTNKMAPKNARISLYSWIRRTTPSRTQYLPHSFMPGHRDQRVGIAARRSSAAFRPLKNEIVAACCTDAAFLPNDI